MPQPDRTSHADVLLLARKNQLAWILLVGVGVPVVVDYFINGKFSYPPLLLGLLLTLLGFVLDLILSVQRLRDDTAASSYSVWRGVNKSDQRLIEARQLTDKLWSESNSLLIKFFNKGLLDLRDEMQEASASGRLVRPQSDQTRKWLLSFAEGEIIFLTHLTSHNRQVFGGDESWRSFHRTMATKIVDGSLKGVHRLFILESVNDARDKILEDQVSLHKTRAHYDCRILLRRQFEEIKKHHEFGSQERDFGIYGRYVYQWISDGAQETGVFMVDERRLRTYRRLYDALWQAGQEDLTEFLAVHRRPRERGASG